MTRRTMHTWLQACPECGYVASKLTDKPTVDADFLKTENYVNCGGIPFSSDLAKNFYRLYLIKKHDGDARNAFWSALEAAWASDDAGDEGSALKARLAALPQIDLWIEKDGIADNLVLLKTDVLRRTRNFAKGIEFVQGYQFKDEFHHKIGLAEIDLCQKEDDACHTIADVVETEKEE